MEMINGDGQCHGTYHDNPDYPEKNCTYKDRGFSGQIYDADWDSKFHEYSIEWG